MDEWILTSRGGVFIKMKNNNKIGIKQSVSLHTS